MSWRAGLAALLAAGAVLAALVLLSRAVVEADVTARRAEAVRLALWRLDARAAGLVAVESARPAGAWRSFVRGEDAGGRPVLLPSPLLALPSPPVRLHVLDQDGRLSSPQVPPAAQRRLAAGLLDDAVLAEAERRFADLAPRLAALRAAPAAAPVPGAVAVGMAAGTVANALAEAAPRAEAGAAAEADQARAPVAQAAPAAPAAPAHATVMAADALAAPVPAPPVAAAAPADRREYAARSANLREQQAAQREVGSPFASSLRTKVAAKTKAEMEATASLAERKDGSAPPLRADLAMDQGGAPAVRWLGDDLVLVQALRLDGRAASGLTVVDWPAWSAALGASIGDLLPAARLRPAAPGDAMVLAALPVALDPGPLAAGSLAAATVWTLAAAWAAGLAGLAAALWVVWAAQRLAERRAAFVSAVTHELRTPLTALRLHGDLLADPRVGDDQARRGRAVAAVRGEAVRLAHLIDNVLDYARLERRRPPAPRPGALPELLAPLLARLDERLAAAGLAFTAGPIPALTVRCDPAAVERILLNLADNAGKYARAGGRVELAVRAAGRRVELRLRDHGPGLAADVRARLFTPFARSAEAAAGSAPGVGLGLALCRRLARAQGGDLRLEPADGGGLVAVLRLPAA